MTSTPAIMNSVIWSVWTMPTAAQHLAPAPRGAPKKGAVRGRRRPDPTGSCEFPTIATVHVKPVIPWP